MKLYSLQYSMETGAVDFNNQEIDVLEPFHNPVLEDDLYIEIFFPGVEELAVKTAFLQCLEDFTATTILVAKFSKNAYDCNFSEDEILIIKESASDAIKKFCSMIDMV